jgi:ABC-type ATPase with predicted acetyltransferase domain
MLTITKLNPPDLPRLSLLDDMWVEPGTKDDWAKLHHLHYKSADSSDGASAIWRCVHGDDLVGIVMMKTPDILSRERHIVFPKLKPTGKETRTGNTARMDLHINQNFMRITRTVTSTIYRGCGAGYRMINLASRMQGMRYMEIVSAMSRYNQFVEKSGFYTVPSTPSVYFDETQNKLRQYFQIENLQDITGLLEEYQTFHPKVKTQTLKELQDYYFKISAREKTGSNKGKTVESSVRKLTFKRIITQISQIAFTRKKYGVYENPDLGLELPKRIKLTAFDEQGTSERLIG